MKLSEVCALINICKTVANPTGSYSYISTSWLCISRSFVQFCVARHANTFGCSQLTLLCLLIRYGIPNYCPPVSQLFLSCFCT